MVPERSQSGEGRAVAERFVSAARTEGMATHKQTAMPTHQLIVWPIIFPVRQNFIFFNGRCFSKYSKIKSTIHLGILPNEAHKTWPASISIQFAGVCWASQV